ncbi:homogeneously-staining region [Tanacetum coccineum]
MVTSRSLLSIAVQNQWNIKQLDINNAFLHGDLNEEVYMTILQGYPKSLPPNTILNVKHAATPMDPIVKLNETDGYLLFDPSTYRTLVGKLLYLTITRPDLSFAAQALSQYSHSTRSSHFEALIRVLRYVKLCPGQGSFFPQQKF